MGVATDLFCASASQKADATRRLRFVARPVGQGTPFGSPLAAKFDQKPSMIRASAICVDVRGTVVSLCQTYGASDVWPAPIGNEGGAVM